MRGFPACFHLDFWLAPFDMFLCIYWSSWLLWFWLIDTQSKCTLPYSSINTEKKKSEKLKLFTWIMPTSFAPSPIARVMASFTCCLTSRTTWAFWRGDTLYVKKIHPGQDGFWLVNKVARNTHPIRCKSKPNRTLVARGFPRFPALEPRYESLQCFHWFVVSVLIWGSYCFSFAF